MIPGTSLISWFLHNKLCFTMILDNISVNQSLSMVKLEG